MSMDSVVNEPTSAWRDRFNGLLFVALLSMAVYQLAQWSLIKSLSLSPLVLGIVCGMLYGNLLRGSMPIDWGVGVNFAARRLLRVAVALYGLNISVQQIMEVGVPGLVVSIGVAAGILALGAWLGTRWLNLDRDTAILTAAGSAICGAAAVLAFESTLRSAPHKSAVAVATVVLFGTVSMLLYPILFRLGWLPFDGTELGIFLGGSIHEVAQVVAAASNIDPATTEVATIVKMTRVALLVPLLLVIGLWLQRRDKTPEGLKPTLPVPWFAIGFLACALINSTHLVPEHWLHALRQIDVFLLTMAMTALGIQTRFANMKTAGPRVLLLAAVLFVALFALTGSLIILVS
jgi:uncharacterized integral membrane protein (TIGR00698 family)